MEKPILYIDMDGTLVDFQSGIDRLDEKTRMLYNKHYDSKTDTKYGAHYDDVPGIFALMDPMPGAIKAVEELTKRYDLYILSTAPWNNPTAWCDKLNWVKRYFGGGEDSVFYKRLILSHHKDLCRGSILIDDRPEKWGAGNFDGEVIHFGEEPYKTWPEVVKHLMGL
ncbi:MAG: hypothetical protein K6A41_09785 [Bacteroidales bacterium]|nr:hypothetical protein [Bacteroidales bacterium]